MLSVPLTDIVIDEGRIRKEFSKIPLEELKASIDEWGLIHPLVCRGGADGQLHLVAGERRLRCLSALILEGKAVRCLGVTFESGLVPIVLQETMTPDEALGIELEENIRRADISWQERVQATERLHVLRQRQNPQHNLAATAVEMFGTNSKATVVSNRVLLTQAMATRPEVANAPSEKEALRRMAASMEQEMLAELQRRAEKQDKESPFRLHTGDCLTILPTLLKASFDVVVTDPPYGIDAHKFDYSSSTDGHGYDDSEAYFTKNIDAWVTEITTCCKPKAHLWMFCAFEQFNSIVMACLTNGWRVYPRPVIWSKGPGAVGNAALWPQRAYECILFAIRGDKPAMGKLQTDVITIPPAKDKSHAAEKPVELYRHLLERSVMPGDSVLDPFCGSGVVFEAAKVVRCKATGIDINTEAAAARLERMKG